MEQRGGVVWVLPDGGRLWEPPESRTQPVGDVGIPSPVIYQHPGDKNLAGYEMTFEVRKGRPVCTEVRLSAKPEEGLYIRPSHLKEVAGRLETSLHDWLAFIAREPGKRPGAWVKRGTPSPEEHRRTRRLVESARHSRRKITDEFLQTVADTYNAVGKPGSVEAVEAVQVMCGCKPRRAWDYVKLARERGFLPEREQ